MDARRDVHAAGACTPSGSTGRPTSSWRSSPPCGPRADGARCRSCTGSAASGSWREATGGHLAGYEGAQPVRIGNDAYRQRQNGVFGAVLDSFLLHARAVAGNSLRGCGRSSTTRSSRRSPASWRLPDQGIWEARGDPQHYVSSKLMCWVALDRGARLAARRGKNEIADRWRAGRQRDPCRDHGTRHRRERPLHASTTAPRTLDASLLLIPLVRFLPDDDARVRNTVHGDRRRADRERAGPALPHRRDRRRPVSGQEGTFLICSFWLGQRA